MGQRILNGALKAEILERMARGHSLERICQDGHMPHRSAIYREFTTDPDFREQCDRARKSWLAADADGQKRGTAILAATLVATLNEADPTFRARFLDKLSQAHHALRDSPEGSASAL